MQASLLSPGRGELRESCLTQRRKGAKDEKHQKKTPGTSQVPGVFNGARHWSEKRGTFIISSFIP